MKNIIKYHIYTIDAAYILQLRVSVKKGRYLYFIYANNEPKFVLAQDLGVAKRRWRLFSNDRNGV